MINMDDLNKHLKKRVMRRVYGIWFLRQISPVAVGMPFSAGVALWFTSKEFFVARIIDNFTTSVHSGSFTSVFNFVISALGNAPLLPTAIIGFSIGLFLILGYKLTRNFKQLVLVRI